MRFMAFLVNRYEMLRVVVFGYMAIQQNRPAFLIRPEGLGQGGFDLFGTCDADSDAALAFGQ